MKEFFMNHDLENDVNKIYDSFEKQFGSEVPMEVVVNKLMTEYSKATP